VIVMLLALARDIRRDPDTPAQSSAGPPVALALVERGSDWFATAPLEERSNATRASIERVIDGDTVDVQDAGQSERVRFFGIDTPERGDACFSEASARTTALVGREVLLVPDRRLEDSGGRKLRYVFGLDGRSIDATLVAEGFARAWRADGVLRDRLVAIEDDERRAHRGCLWH